ncbi:hypothetical protein FSP39_009552 [Pinctada imbricata]|uniref:Anti-proliferative protein domain-containing protein n=1 Tax=Pinctada imbricata TaxID=66713 RepID=A0AA89C745_PINIB|nr:hypothetical protein FSP39_009552 [Pinctada imbricata]
MKKEIKSAVDFLSNILRISKRFTEDQISNFNSNLQNLLCLRYESHWFPEKPCKGSGFRCIRINHNMDPVIKEAGQYSGISESQLHSLLPKELTMWVDPHDVSYRIGENGSIGVLFESNSNTVQSSTQNSNSLIANEFDSKHQLPYSSTTCKGQFNNFSNMSREMNLKQLAAFVYS